MTRISPASINQVNFKIALYSFWWGHHYDMYIWGYFSDYMSFICLKNLSNIYKVKPKLLIMVYQVPATPYFSNTIPTTPYLAINTLKIQHWIICSSCYAVSHLHVFVSTLPSIWNIIFSFPPLPFVYLKPILDWLGCHLLEEAFHDSYTPQFKDHFIQTLAQVRESI